MSFSTNYSILAHVPVEITFSCFKYKQAIAKKTRLKRDKK
jgi:hypothetical protein